LDHESKGRKRVTTAEMEYLTKTAGYAWTDYKTNKGTVEKLNITSVLDNMQDFRRNWLHQINRMPIVNYREY
jgi:hypothetical protein